MLKYSEVIKWLICHGELGEPPDNYVLCIKSMSGLLPIQVGGLSPELVTELSQDAVDSSFSEQSGGSTSGFCSVKSTFVGYTDFKETMTNIRKFEVEANKIRHIKIIMDLEDFDE